MGRARDDKRRAAPEAVERERRERERRDRDRRRQQALEDSARTTRPAPARVARPKPAPAATAAVAAVRQRREGLTGWIGRQVRALVDGTGQILRGFALEVGTVCVAMLRSIVMLVPGVRWLVQRRQDEEVAPSRISSLAKQATKKVRSARDAGVPQRAGGGARSDAARRTRLRRRLQLVLGVALLASAIAAAVLVPRSDAFRIRHVEVSGAAAVSDLQVRQRVDELLAGKTIFTVDADAITERIREFPFVQDVRVERHIPGGLELHVTEYRPLALALGDGAFWLVSRDGRILSKAVAEQWRGRVPVVTLRSKDIRLGMRLEGEPALELLAARGSRSSLTFETIEAEDHRLVATMPSGIEIRFGRGAQLRQKLLAAELALAEARRAKLTPKYVDVSVPAKPAICDRAVVACGMARSGREVDEEATAGAATTPEEVGGDEAVVEAGAGVGA